MTQRDTETQAFTGPCRKLRFHEDLVLEQVTYCVVKFCIDVVFAW